MYTIFKNDCTIILTDCLKNNRQNNFFKWVNINLDSLMLRIEKNEINKLIIYHSDIKLLWNQFKEQFKIIEAAGGVVFNENDILFIFRMGKWDLPKGKIEKGETIQETAIREVKEECGLKNLTLVDFICSTYHIYKESEIEVLKISHWFKMFSTEKVLIPQVEEDITKVEWKNKVQVKSALENTYPNIKLLLEKIK